MMMKTNKKKKLLKTLSTSRGFAIMYAFSAILLISTIVISLSKDTLINYRISAKAIDRVKAYYAAMSGIEISMLRIQIYRVAVAKLGQVLQDPKQKAMLDMIWSMPLPWPPVIDSEAQIEKDALAKTLKESFMDVSYLASIADEGTKIDINDLASKSKALRQSVRNQIINLIRAKLDSDSEKPEDKLFRETHRNTDLEEVLNNITDWIDQDEESLNGGAESALYDVPASSGDSLPPNRSFRTSQELRMVAGVDDMIFDLLEPRITVYGTKGINVNYASAEVLMSLSEELTLEKAKQIVSRRSDPILGPFTSAQQFVDYVASEPTISVSIETEGDQAIPILTESVVNFRIQSQGISRGTAREIVAVIYDVDKVTSRMVDFLQKEQPKDDNPDDQQDDKKPDDKKKNGNPTADSTDGQPNDPNSPDKGPRGRPRIVYWQIK